MSGDLTRERSLRLSDLKVLAQELDLDEQRQKREARNTSHNAEIEFLSPPTSLHGSAGRGLARDNMPYRLGKKNGGLYPANVVGRTTLPTFSNHDTDTTSQSIGVSAGYDNGNLSMYHNSSLTNHDSFGINSNSGSESSFYYHHQNEGALHRSAPSCGFNGIVSGEGSGSGLDATTIKPAMLHRSQTTGDTLATRPLRSPTSNRRGLAGKRGMDADRRRSITSAGRTPSQIPDIGAVNPMGRGNRSEDDNPVPPSAFVKDTKAGSSRLNPVQRSQNRKLLEFTEDISGRSTHSRGGNVSPVPEHEIARFDTDTMPAALLSDLAVSGRTQQQQQQQSRRNQRRSNLGDRARQKPDTVATLGSSNSAHQSASHRTVRGGHDSITCFSDHSAQTAPLPVNYMERQTSTSNDSTANKKGLSSNLSPLDFTRLAPSAISYPAACGLTDQPVAALMNDCSTKSDRSRNHSSVSGSILGPELDDRMEDDDGKEIIQQTSDRSWVSRAANGLDDGAVRNNLRREKFGLSEPKETTMMVSLGKDSKHTRTKGLLNSDAGGIGNSQHSSASSAQPEQMYVGAYRVRQPRSIDQQRPGVSPDEDLSIAPAPMPSSDLTHPPECMMVNIDAAKQKEQVNSRVKIYVGGVLVAALVIIVIIVAAATASKKSGNTPPLEHSDGDEEFGDLVLPTRAPATDMEGFMLSLLPEATAEMIATLADVGGNHTSALSLLSPQQQAFNWITEDPSLINYSNSRLLQRFALATLYYAMNGIEWSKRGYWLSYDHHECAWSDHDIECDVDESDLATDDFVSGAVLGLKLIKHKLQGTIPMELSFLTSAQVLDLSENALTGTIPIEIGTMARLRRIILNENALSGSIPSSVGLLTSLDALSAHTNALAGSLATEFGKLAELTELVLSKNQISGTLPSEFGLLSLLSGLFLDGNHIMGGIPAELGSLARLKDLHLNENQMGGSLPVSIGNLTMLGRLILGSNSFSGTLPTEIGRLSSVVAFEVAKNKLIGRIPSELSAMGTSTLRSLSMHENALTGTIPSLVGLSYLSDIRLNSNKLTSTIPVNLPKTLKHLALDVNLLTGPLPSEIGALTDLVELWLFSNRLTGTIPSELGLCSNMDRLVLDQNLFDGTLPEQISNLDQLREFNISSTQLSGSIPGQLCGIMFVDFTCGTTMCGCNKCPCER